MPLCNAPQRALDLGLLEPNEARARSYFLQRTQDMELESIRPAGADGGVALKVGGQAESGSNGSSPS